MRGKHSDPYVHCANKKESPSPVETLANLLILGAILWVLFKVFEVIVKEVVIPFFTFLADEIIIPFIRWADRGITRGCDAINKKLGWGVDEPVERPAIRRLTRLSDDQNKPYFSNSAWRDGPPHAPRLRLTR